MIEFSKSYIDFQIPRILFEIGETLLKIEEFDKAKVFLLQAIKTSEIVSNKKDLIYLYTNHFLDINKGLLLALTIGNLNEAVNIIKRKVFFESGEMKQNSENKFRNLNKAIIRFLIQINKLIEAKSIAKKLDKTDNESKNMDYYFFCLGKKFSESYFYLPASITIVDNIKDKVLKIELLLEIAERFYKIGNVQEFNEIMNRTSGLLIEGKNDVYIVGKAKEIALVWLEAGYPEKALEIIKYEKDEHDRSKIIYDIAQVFAINYKIQFAEKLADRVNNFYKGLILSKVAARKMCNGQYNEAIENFKRSVHILLEKRSECFIGYIFRDYLNAKIYNKVVTSDFMR